MLRNEMCLARSCHSALLHSPLSMVSPFSKPMPQLPGSVQHLAQLLLRWSLAVRDRNFQSSQATPSHTQVLGTPSCVSKSSQLLLLRIPFKLQQNVGEKRREKSKPWSESQTALGTKSPLPQDLNTCEHP